MAKLLKKLSEKVKTTEQSIKSGIKKEGQVLSSTIKNVSKPGGLGEVIKNTAIENANNLAFAPLAPVAPALRKSLKQSGIDPKGWGIGKLALTFYRVKLSGQHFESAEEANNTAITDPGNTLGKSAGAAAGAAVAAAAGLPPTVGSGIGQVAGSTVQSIIRAIKDYLAKTIKAAASGTATPDEKAVADAANASVTRSGDKVSADISGDNTDSEGTNTGKNDNQEGFGGMEKTLMYIVIAVVGFIILKKVFKF